MYLENLCSTLYQPQCRRVYPKRELYVIFFCFSSYSSGHTEQNSPYIRRVVHNCDMERRSCLAKKFISTQTEIEMPENERLYITFQLDINVYISKIALSETINYSGVFFTWEICARVAIVACGPLRVYIVKVKWNYTPEWIYIWRGGGYKILDIRSPLFYIRKIFIV